MPSSLPDNSSGALSALVPFLDRLGYDVLLRSALGARYYTRPAIDFKQDLRAVLAHCPQDLRVAVRLLLLHDAVARAQVLEVFPQKFLDALVDAEVLETTRRGYRTAANLSLVSAWGKYLWLDDTTVPGARPEEIVYIGVDSFLLGSQLQWGDGQRALDIGTGSGLLAMLCADHFPSVTATDIDPRSVKQARLNARMNSLLDGIDVLQADVYPEGAERFDYICANPPFLPVPDGVPVQPWANGGRDGLNLVRPILAGLSAHLAPGGRCQVLCTSPVLQDGTRLIDGLLDKLLDEGMDCLMQVFQVMPTGRAVAERKAVLARFLNESPASASRRWRTHFRSLGAKAVAMLLVTLERPHQPMGRGTLRVMGPIYPNTSRRPAPKQDAWLHRAIGEAILAKLGADGGER